MESNEQDILLVTSERCMSFNRLSLVAVVAAISAAPAMAAGPYQFFGYKNAKGEPRMCRGETSTGAAVCTSSATTFADVKDASPIAWQTDAGNAEWYSYPALFEKAGAFELFAYNNKKGEPRVCAGDTASGEVRCADTTASLAKTKGPEKPAFTVDAANKSTVFRYFPVAKAGGTAGTFTFGAYLSKDGSARVCQMETKTGTTVCVGNAATQVERVGDGKLPEWKPETPVGSTLQYFKGL